MAGLLKVPWIWESWKGQTTRVIWMPNALCFLKAVIATLFSISKNFLNSSTTINSTRVPKMPDCFSIQGKLFLGTKKNTKPHHTHTHTHTHMLPAPTEGEEQELLMVEREWWLSFKKWTGPRLPGFPCGKLRSWLTPWGMPQEVTAGPGLQAEENTISSSKSSSFRAQNSPADRTWSKSTQSECGRLRERRLPSHKNDFRITGQVFWGQSERIGHFARKWTTCGNFMTVLQRSKENGDQMLPTATRGREGGNWPQGGHLFLGRLFKGSGHV